jgi:hypothetical protein
MRIGIIGSGRIGATATLTAPEAERALVEA